MADLRITTINREQSVLDESSIEALKVNLRGELLTPDSADYDEARSMWNAMIDRRPALIVPCVGTADVIRGRRLCCLNQNIEPSL